MELARGVLHFGSGEGFGGPSSAAKIFHSALGEGLEGGEADPISKASGTSISCHRRVRGRSIREGPTGLPVSYVDPRIRRIRVWRCGGLPRE